MAHFAEIDASGNVLRVIVVSNFDILDINGNESEQVGKNFCENLFDGIWVQTSYNSNFRKNFAGIGYTYDSQRDAFIPPKPYSSWILDDLICRWMPPIPYPQDGKNYKWNDVTNNWEEVAT